MCAPICSALTLAVLVVAPSPGAPGDLKDYLTKDGQLTTTLEVTHSIHPSAATWWGPKRKWTIQPSGAWTIEEWDRISLGRQPPPDRTSKGALNKKQRLTLARALARADARALEDHQDERTKSRWGARGSGPGRYSSLRGTRRCVRVRYGERLAVFWSRPSLPLPLPIPPPGRPKTLSNRFGGIVRAVERAIPPIAKKQKPSKARQTSSQPAPPGSPRNTRPAEQRSERAQE
jgi:hypothetical protein